METVIKIQWLDNGFIQTKRLVHCRENRQGFITMNSPIYQAIEDGSLCIDLGYGKHCFIII